MTATKGNVVIGVLPDTELEAIALRALLEAGGSGADLAYIATPSHFFALVAREKPPALLILCAHGVDGGWHFGALADEFSDGLVNGVLPPAALAGCVKLAGTTVICTGCDTGAPIFATPFLDGGVTAFVAPTIDPDGSAMLLATHHFVYAMLVAGLDAHAASRAASDALGGVVPLAVHLRTGERAPAHVG